MDTLYLWLNLGTIFFPFILSFNKIGHFYTRWKPIFISIGVMSTFVVSWDIIFTRLGVWGFNQDYLIGPSFLDLPLEEWLFFICIPYAFMFLYDQLVVLQVRNILAPIERYFDYFFRCRIGLFLCWIWQHLYHYYFLYGHLIGACYAKGAAPS